MYSSAWDLAGWHAPQAYFRPQNPRPQRHLQGPGAESGNAQLRDGLHIKKARPAYYIATRALKVARGAVHEYNRVAPSAEHGAELLLSRSRKRQHLKGPRRAVFSAHLRESYEANLLRSPVGLSCIDARRPAVRGTVFGPDRNTSGGLARWLAK